MRSESMCDLYRTRLSERMDEPLSSVAARELDDHLSVCAGCRAYETQLHALRRNLRLMPSEPTPDLGPRVLDELRNDRSETRVLRLKLATVGAAAAALLVLATSLPILDNAPDIARGAEVTRGAFRAARALTSYHATLDITERGWHPDIGLRRFDAEIWFRAPETFRLRVRDRTSYPSSAWPDNDVDVVSTPSRWTIREPLLCPPAALPGCAIEAGSEERSIVDRQPFDGAGQTPRDLIVPLDSLSASGVFDVLGTAKVGGRDAYHLSLPFRHAFALAGALQIGGSWTPLAPRDEVDLWVDSETWFPLRFEVARAGRVLLQVETTNLSEGDIFGPSTFDTSVRGSVTDGGFEPGPGPSRDVMPTYVSGLEPYRNGRNAQNQKIATYATGLSYLKVIVDRRTTPSSALASSAEVVHLGKSAGFYRPAEPGAARRIDIYGDDVHVQLASNLRRSELLRIGASVPVRGLIPRLVRDGPTAIERLNESEIARIGFARMPTSVPRGYRLGAAARISDPRGRQLVLHYIPSQAALESAGIRIVQAPGAQRLTPSSEDLQAVELDGVVGRWSDARGELEWIEDGIYRAIAAPSFDRDYVVRLARSLETPR